MPFSPVAHGVPSSETTAASIPGSGIAADPGLIGSKPRPYGLPNTGPLVSVCHMWSMTGTRPPRIVFCSQSQAGGLSTSPAQTTRSRREWSIAEQRLVAVAHQHADGGRRREDAGDAELLDRRPPVGVGVRVIERALECDRRAPDEQRRVDHVAVADDPTDVGRRPPDVGRPQAKAPFPHRDHVAPGSRRACESRASVLPSCRTSPG